MLEFWIWFCVVLWVGWCVQALLSILMVRKLFYRRIQKDSPRVNPEFKPFAHLVVPVKGTDDDLEANISTLCQQDYPDYRIVFVVESEEDPAFAAITEILARTNATNTSMLIAGKSDGRQGQKVHNQLKALELLDAESSDEDIWVFADSDAVPGPKWLRRLVSPLWLDDQVGATTGYRWFAPDVKRPSSFWSHVVSVMNSSVLSFCGRHQFNRAWGGSMALRVSTAREGGLRSQLVGALTDDYQLTRMVREQGRVVHFVANCIVPSPSHFTWASMTNFVRRQYLITRVYQPTDYFAALGLTALYVAGFWSSLVIGLVGVVTNSLNVWHVGAIAAFGFVLICDQLRAMYRARIIDYLFDDQTCELMRTTRWVDRWLTPFWMSLHFGLIASVAFSRRMVWRGVSYRIRGRQDVEVIDVNPSADG